MSAREMDATASYVRACCSRRIQMEVGTRANRVKRWAVFLASPIGALPFDDAHRIYFMHAKVMYGLSDPAMEDSSLRRGIDRVRFS